MTHTPGPWTVVVANTGAVYITGGKPLEDGLNPIASMDGDPDELDDNARLMAAAPDLLDALRDLLDATPTPLRNHQQVAAFQHGLQLVTKLAAEEAR